MEVTAISLSAGDWRITIQNQRLPVDRTDISTKKQATQTKQNKIVNGSQTKHSSSKKGVLGDLDVVVLEIDNIILDICKSAHDDRVRKKLCDEIQSCYFTASEDGNDFARDYLFSALTNKLKKRSQEFGSRRDKVARKEAINIYSFLCSFYFYIFTSSWSKLLLQFESRILMASCYLLQPSSFGETAEICESLSTWLLKLGPRLHAHFSKTFSDLMDLVRDRFLDDMTTELARQHLIILIDCHARGWAIRFE